MPTGVVVSPNTPATEVLGKGPSCDLSDGTLEKKCIFSFMPVSNQTATELRGAQAAQAGQDIKDTTADVAGHGTRQAQQAGGNAACAASDGAASASQTAQDAKGAAQRGARQTADAASAYAESVQLVRSCRPVTVCRSPVAAEQGLHLHAACK